MKFTDPLLSLLGTHNLIIIFDDVFILSPSSSASTSRLKLTSRLELPSSICTPAPQRTSASWGIVRSLEIGICIVGYIKLLLKLTCSHLRLLVIIVGVPGVLVVCSLALLVLALVIVGRRKRRLLLRWRELPSLVVLIRGNSSLVCICAIFFVLNLYIPPPSSSGLPSKLVWIVIQRTLI